MKPGPPAITPTTSLTWAGVSVARVPVTPSSDRQMPASPATTMAVRVVAILPLQSEGSGCSVQGRILCSRVRVVRIGVVRAVGSRTRCRLDLARRGASRLRLRPSQRAAWPRSTGAVETDRRDASWITVPAERIARERCGRPVWPATHHLHRSVESEHPGVEFAEDKVRAVDGHDWGVRGTHDADFRV
jgi:hypothetical protein